ncbi:maleylpyruvate isomerase family mycothiol-dependent enzyme [Nocardioides panacisoli]|uniref:Maleylpyruvate isomerase family mycothiol-dependent enzyme n=1 Tax=Nocardioides panacisoli TaxID=627624 RepID=A0ABP7IYU8_9ACTN
MNDDAGRGQDRLRQYVDTWWQAIGDFTALIDGLPESAAPMATDLPGWDVAAIVAHVAHLEHLSVGGAHDEVPGIEIGAPAHVRSMMSVFTEQGVHARRDGSMADAVAAIRRDTARRREQLAAGVPDPAAPADGVFGAIGWTWGTLLRNRPLDVWMHEQDVRRAVGLPGGMDTAPARHSADYLTESFPVVVGKRVQPPSGTSAVLEVEGSEPVAVEVDANGRAQRLPEVPAEPDVRLSTDRETFIVVAGGRRAPAEGEFRIEGDQALGQQIVEQLAVTP